MSGGGDLAEDSIGNDGALYVAHGLSEGMTDVIDNDWLNVLNYS